MEAGFLCLSRTWPLLEVSMLQMKYDPTEMGHLRDLIRSEAGGEDLPEITLEMAVVGRKTLEKLPSLLDGVSGDRVKSVLMVTDETPIRRGPEILRNIVATILNKEGIETERITLKSDKTGVLRADMDQVMTVKSRIRRGGGIIGIGGGTIADICKYAIYLAEGENQKAGEIPLIVCQTATSGSAFGSNQSVIFKDGVKRTIHSIYPDVVVADMDVITDAPRELNRSGFGDMIAVLISSLDWYVSHMIGMSPGYSKLAVNIMHDSGQALLHIAPQIGAMSPQGLEVVAKILVMMGIVSSMGYGTAPISGFEHMISHALDMEGLANGRKLALHGAQVGLGAVYASVAYHLFIREFSPQGLDLTRCYPTDEEAFEEVRGRFAHLDPEGKSIEQIWIHYHEKLTLWRNNRSLFEEFLADWDKPGGPKDQISAEMTPVQQVIEALFLSGNPTLPEELSPPISKDLMKFAFLNARFMRNRFIMNDLLGFAGLMNERFWHRVDTAVRRMLAQILARKQASL